jgi:hypothetical protein
LSERKLSPTGRTVNFGRAQRMTLPGVNRIPSRACRRKADDFNENDRFVERTVVLNAYRLLSNATTNDARWATLSGTEIHG